MALSFPTLEEVEQANRIQLARWYRFLPSPGFSAADTNRFPEVFQHETKVLSRILERFHALGGFDPELSKVVGWD